MKSRTSFFNFTVFRKDITRFSPVWALYLIGMVLSATSMMNTYHYSATAKTLMGNLPAYAGVNLCYALITAQLLFGDLFNRRLCNALHAMPIRREGWFFTHCAAGLLFSLVPNLVIAVMFIPAMKELWFIALLWLLAVTLQYLFFFGTAVFAAVCTGQRFAAAALYALVNFGSTIVWWFVNTFYEPLLKGVVISQVPFLQFSPAANLIGQLGSFVTFVRYQQNGRNCYAFAGLTEQWWYLAIVAVAGLVFLAVSLLLYRRRKLEKAGDFVAFRFLEPVFCVMLTLSAGAFLQLMFGGEIFLIVGCVVGFFASQMLLQRRVNVFKKKTFITMGIFLGALILSLVLTFLDPIGITRWTPNPQSVQSVTMVEIYGFDPKTDQAYSSATLDKPAEIERMIDIHELLIKDGFSQNSTSWLSGVYGARRGITIVYNLQDGRTVCRSYYYPLDSEIVKQLSTVFSSPKYVMGYNNWADFIENVEEVAIDGEPVSKTLVEGLLTAVYEDCEAGTIELEKYSDVKHYIEYSYEGRYRTVSVHSISENTLKFIKEHALA